MPRGHRLCLRATECSAEGLNRCWVAQNPTRAENPNDVWPVRGEREHHDIGAGPAGCRRRSPPHDRHQVPVRTRASAGGQCSSPRREPCRARRHDPPKPPSAGARRDTSSVHRRRDSRRRQRPDQHRRHGAEPVRRVGAADADVSSTCAPCSTAARAVVNVVVIDELGFHHAPRSANSCCRAAPSRSSPTYGVGRTSAHPRHGELVVRALPRHRAVPDRVAMGMSVCPRVLHHPTGVTAPERRIGCARRAAIPVESL